MMAMHSRMLMAAALVIVSAAPAAAQISAHDRAQAVDVLTKSRDQVLTEAGTLSDAQWSFKPGPDRWSVGEVVEHLALAESFLFDMQQKLAAAPAASPDLQKKAAGNDATILKRVADRTQKASAPEPIQPKTRLGSREEVLAAFRERRAKTLDYATKTTADLRSRVAESQPFGAVDAYQWLLFIGAHTERHLGQLREVKADARFPK